MAALDFEPSRPHLKMDYKRILLTGGAGFIGSHVAEALLRRGVELAIVDDLDDFYDPQRKRANLDEIRRQGTYAFFHSDVCDRDALGRIFAEFRPDAVVHLAARAGVRPSIEQPLLYERVNVGGTSNLLEVCRLHQTSKLVFGSSSSIYGASSRAPFSEDQVELRPLSPYAATKIAGEALAYTYAHLFGIAVVCLRFFTVYGPRQRPDLAIHKFTALMEAGKPIPVFGDGTSGRDYTYIDDIVAGVLASITFQPASAAGAPFEVLNLGNSHPVTLNELIALLEHATGRKAVRQALPFQPGDVPLTWADVSKAGRLLGYKPATPIEQGLAKFVAWFRSRRASQGSAS